MKEFNIGDRVAVLGRIMSINNSRQYPISIIVNGSNLTEDVTIDGKIHKHDTQQNVYHLEDLQTMYDKEMYVSSVDKDYSHTVYVIGKSNNGNYLAIHMRNVEFFKRGKPVTIYQFKYAHPLTAVNQRNLIKERNELIKKLTDIIIEIQQSNI